jgi:hypothetical protein
MVEKQNVIKDFKKKKMEEQRRNGFIDYMNRIQGKEEMRVDNEILETITKRLYEVYGAQDITRPMVRNVMKELNFSSLLDHLPQIGSRITGKSCHDISPARQHTFVRMYEAIQTPFAKYCPPERHNFLNNSFCFAKFCIVTGCANEYGVIIEEERNRKSKSEEEIWKNICIDLQWTNPLQGFPIMDR